MFSTERYLPMHPSTQYMQFHVVTLIKPLFTLSQNTRQIFYKRPTNNELILIYTLGIQIFHFVPLPVNFKGENTSNSSERVAPLSYQQVIQKCNTHISVYMGAGGDLNCSFPNQKRPISDFMGASPINFIAMFNYFVVKGTALYQLSICSFDTMFIN